MELEFARRDDTAAVTNIKKINDKNLDDDDNDGQQNSHESSLSSTNTYNTNGGNRNNDDNKKGKNTGRNGGEEEKEEELASLYLDNARWYKMPEAVLGAIDSYYSNDNANVHRGAHWLAAKATEGYENARQRIAQLVGAADYTEIVYTRGATEAINLLASTWGDQQVHEGDEIILSTMEHHSMILPWQRLAARKKAVLKYVRVDENGSYDLRHLKELLSPRTKLVGLCHASNVLGTLNPIEKVSQLARESGALVLVDASQTMARAQVNVRELGCDFLVASGHKMMGPTGIGFLWGKYKLLDMMQPWQGGGEMIDEVFLERSTYAPPPGRFEAGTPAIAEAIGIGAAIGIIMDIGTRNIQMREEKIGAKLFSELKAKVPGIEILGGEANRLGIVSFNLEGVPPQEVERRLRLKGIKVGVGFHEAQPLHHKLGFDQGSVRVSFSQSNTEKDVERLIRSVTKVAEDIRNDQTLVA